MKIAIAGVGYVGLSLATLLSQYNEVVALDIIKDKVDRINSKISPIEDKYIEKYLRTKKLNLRATLDYKDAFDKADFIIICMPTNYDEKSDFFDTSLVEETIEKIKNMKIQTTIIIKSTVPVGFTERMKTKYNMNNIIFSPEFLREGKALYDNLYPSRIILGDKNEQAKKFADLLKESSLKKDVTIKFMKSTEAEAVKLFSNTYLALRIAYFNELDTYAEIKGLNTKNLIEGVCMDQRIGDFYNNPSFGYGGYCLPKDTKQLKANYRDVPENLITAIVNSNATRKQHILEEILSKIPKNIGIYKLSMKKNSDNFRASAIFDVIDMLIEKNKNIIIYEPRYENENYKNCKIVSDIKAFKENSSIIIANRIEEELEDVMGKVYTRDIYFRD